MNRKAYCKYLGFVFLAFVLLPLTSFVPFAASLFGLVHLLPAFLRYGTVGSYFSTANITLGLLLITVFAVRATSRRLADLNWSPLLAVVFPVWLLGKFFTPMGIFGVFTFFLADGMWRSFLFSVLQPDVLLSLAFFTYLVLCKGKSDEKRIMRADAERLQTWLSLDNQPTRAQFMVAAVGALAFLLLMPLIVAALFVAIRAAFAVSSPPKAVITLLSHVVKDKSLHSVYSWAMLMIAGLFPLTRFVKNLSDLQRKWFMDISVLALAVLVVMQLWPTTR